MLGEEDDAAGVQLEREGVSGGQAGEPRTGEELVLHRKQGAEGIGDCEGVQARSRSPLGQSSAPEGISIRHRQIVKDYFMNLREGSQR